MAEVLTIDSMLDASTPSNEIADRLNRNQLSLFFVFNPGFVHTVGTDKYLFVDGASTNRLSVRWDADTDSWVVSDGTNTATVADTFNPTDTKILTISADKKSGADVDGSGNKLAIWTGATAGTQSASYLADTPGDTLVFKAENTDGDFVGDFTLIEVGIYDRPLSADDRAILENSGAGAPAAHASISPLVSFAGETLVSGRSASLAVSATTATTATVAGGTGAFADNDAIVVYDEIGEGVWGLIAGTPASAMPLDDGEGGNIARLANVGVYTDLDGTNYWDGGNIIDVTTGDVAFGFWVKTTSTAEGTIVSKRDAGDGYRIYMDGSGFINVYTEWDVASFTRTGTVAVNDGEWHEVFVGYDRNSGGNSGIYIDGKVDVTFVTVNATTLTNTDPFRVGADSDAGASNKFTGKIADLHAYNSLSISGINDTRRAAYDLASAPRQALSINGSAEDGWWRFDDASFAVDADDSSAGNNNLTPVSTPARVQEGLTLSRNLLIDPNAEASGVGSWERFGSVVFFSPNFFEKQATTLDTDSASMKLETTTTGGGIVKKFTAPRGATVTFEAWYNHENVSGTFNFVVYDATLGANLAGTVTLVKDDSWHRHEWTVAIDNTGAFLHDIELRISASGAASGVFIVLDRLSVHESRMAGGDCESTAGWSAIGGASVTLDSVREHSATNAIDVSTSSDTQGAEHALDTLKTNTFYEVSAHFRADNGTTPVDLTLTVANLGDASGDTTRTFTQDNAGPEYAEHDRRAVIFMTGTDQSGDFQSIRDSGSGSERWYIDDVAMIERHSVGVATEEIVIVNVYDEVWADHTQQLFQVLIESVDLTGKVAELGEIELSLDPETLASFAASDVDFSLANPDAQFSTTLASNFFTDNGLPAHGRKADVEVKLGFKRGTATLLQSVFCGNIAEIDLTTDHDRARIVAVDKSLLLREATVNDFGIQRLSATLENDDYTASDPVFNFPNLDQPISHESVNTVTADASAVTVVPSVRTEGKLSADFAAVDYSAGQLRFEAEPAGGSGAAVLASYKTAYRFLRPDTLAKRILEKFGLSDVSLVDRVSLTHFDTSADAEWFSSHGRPNHSVDPVAIVQYLLMDTTNEVLYLLADEQFIKYDFATDAYTVLANVPDSHVGVKMDTVDFVTFFFLTTDHKEGDSSSDTTEIRIRKWSSAGGWTTVADETDEHPQTTINYDIGVGSEFIAENRTIFAIHNDPGDSKDYLYFRFAEPVGTGVPRYSGIKRYDIALDSFELIIQFDWSDKFGAHFGLDAVVDTTNSYVYTIVTYDDNTYNIVGTLEVWRSTLAGGSDTLLFSQDFTGLTETIQKPFTVSDTVLDEPNDKIYFVCQFGHTTGAENLFGSAEFYYFDIASPGITSMKSYTRFMRAPRGGVMVGTTAYYFEGCQWDAFTGSYADSDEAGHLISIANGVIADEGFVWQSREDDTNQGLHTASTSNIVSDGSGNLLFIAGYGIPGAIETSARTSPFAQDLIPANRADNYILIQWGFDLASKIELYNPNNAQAWSELEMLAQISNFEIGFDCAIPFFRARSVVNSTITSSIAASGGITTIDVADTTRFLGAGVLPNDLGYVIIDKEVFSYTGKTATQLTGVTRAVEESAEAAHSNGAAIYYVSYRAYNHPRRRNLVQIANMRTDYDGVLNEIHVEHGSNEVIDDDATSITEHGVREHTVPSGSLASHDRPWAEILARDYLTDRKDVKHFITATVQMNPLIKPGESLLVDELTRTSIDFSVCRILRVSHDFTAWQTTILARTL